MAMPTCRVRRFSSFPELVMEFKSTHPETGTLHVRLERLTDLTDKVSSREQYQGSKSRHDPVLQSLQSRPSAGVHAGN